VDNLLTPTINFFPEYRFDPASLLPNGIFDQQLYFGGLS